MSAQKSKIPVDLIQLGSFNVVSNAIVVSDPCYEDDVWCRSTLSYTKNGSWKASVLKSSYDDYGERIMSLTVVHEDYEDTNEKDLNLNRAGCEIGVDSGQAGIFDISYYQDDSVFGDKKPIFKVPDEGPGTAWYEHCCDVTLSTQQAGVIPYGAVAASGFGDGAYSCDYFTNTDEEVVKVRVVFITN